MLRHSLTMGFVEGFTACLSFFAPRRMRTQDFNVSLDHAWEKVGVALQAALTERASLGKETGQDSSVGKARNSQAA